MSLEVAVQNLADAINRLVDSGAATSGVDLMQSGALAAEPAKRGRGRPRKTETQAEAPEPSTEEKAAAVAARVAAVSAEATKAAAPVAAPAPELTRAKVQEALIEVVKKHGRDKCGELCRKHGGPNLSALDPAVWPALVADAQELIAQDAE